MLPKGYHFPPAQVAEIKAKHAATRAANLAALALLPPAERLARVAARSANYAAAARRGWETRRRNAGLPPGRAEPTRPVQLYVRDLETLRRLGPDAKRGLRRLLESFRRLAVEVGELAEGVAEELEAVKKNPPGDVEKTAGAVEGEGGSGGVGNPKT